MLRLRWAAFQIVALSYVSLMVPMRIGLEYPAIGLWFALKTLIDAYFVLDIIVNFTALYAHDIGETAAIVDQMASVASGGAEVTANKRKIALVYLRGWFIIDILACAPVELLQRIQAGALACSYRPVNPCTSRATATPQGQAFKLFKLLRAFRVLKLFRLFRLRRLMKKYQDELLYWLPLIQAGKLVFILFFSSHWLGCMYAAVFPFDKAVTRSERYVACVYWAMQTITTVGYGDMGSPPLRCRLVSTFAMAVGALLFGWLLQYVLTVLDPDTPSETAGEDRAHHGLSGPTPCPWTSPSASSATCASRTRARARTARSSARCRASSGARSSSICMVESIRACRSSAASARPS